MSENTVNLALRTNFNSILVQLEAGGKIISAIPKNNFNSILVQLEAVKKQPENLVNSDSIRENK